MDQVIGPTNSLLLDLLLEMDDCHCNVSTIDYFRLRIPEMSSWVRDRWKSYLSTMSPISPVGNGNSLVILKIDKSQT